MKTISPVIRKELIRRLVDEFQPETIYLFGSFAWGRPNEDSDMDLLVIVPESRENPIQRARRAQRSLLGVKAAVDVLVKTREEFQRYTSVKASLEAQISREGKLLYGRKMALVHNWLMKSCRDLLTAKRIASLAEPYLFAQRSHQN